jgi:dihydroxyacetone kinase-like predicted kinase
MTKSLTAAGLVAACAVCCAPLILPILASVGLVGAGAAGAGFLAGVSLDTIICGGIAAAVATGVLAWVLQRRRAAAAQASCNCEAACNTETCSSLPKP